MGKVKEYFANKEPSSDEYMSEEEIKYGMNKQTIQALPTQELVLFTELYGDTESENAYMDGECSQAEGDRRYKKAIKEFTRHLHRIGMKGDYENDADFMMEVYDVLNEVWKELERRDPPTKEAWIKIEKDIK